MKFFCSLIDALWDAGYHMGLRGLFRVPWHNVWGILAQVGMGQGGLGYSVIELTVLYHNGKGFSFEILIFTLKKTDLRLTIF